MMHPPFRYERRVAFSDTDMAGVAHFTAIFRWVEEAEAAWWRERGGTLCATTPDGSLRGWPKVSVHVDFKSPVRFDEVVIVTLSVAKEGLSSRTWEFVIDGRDSGAEVAKGTMTVVHVERTADGRLHSRPLS